jgi:hypothetical protein
LTTYRPFRDYKDGSLVRRHTDPLDTRFFIRDQLRGMSAESMWLILCTRTYQLILEDIALPDRDREDGVHEGLNFPHEFIF